MPYLASIFLLLSLPELRPPILDSLVRLLEVLLAQLQGSAVLLYQHERAGGGLVGITTHTYREVICRFVLARYGKVVLVLCLAERLCCLVLLLDGLLAYTLGAVGRLLDNDVSAHATTGKSHGGGC